MINFFLVKVMQTESEQLGSLFLGKDFAFPPDNKHELRMKTVFRIRIPGKSLKAE
jgi:hypothetical protein